LNALQLLADGDAVSRLVAIVLLGMSTSSWVIILWKTWLLRRAGWMSPAAPRPSGNRPIWPTGSASCRPSTAARWSLPLVAATEHAGRRHAGHRRRPSQQLTRVLREALHAVLLRLQYGQVLLATVGATAPFVGLLGTVWGIYHALIGISSAGQITIDRIAGPVGEALIMTAAGLAVAIPAVLAYNVLGRMIGRIEADLEGFARDLRELLLSRRPRRPGAEHHGIRSAGTHTGRPPMSDINMTPLIDVMLVLVVIFLITAPLLASAIRLDLPRSDAAGASDAAASVLVVVDKAGQVFLDDKPVTDAELATRLTARASQDPDTEVQLRADAAVPTAGWSR
jgi:biopolymer transport protein ExbB